MATLESSTILKAMHSARMISSSEAKRIVANLRDASDKKSQHPLLQIASQLPTNRDSNAKYSTEELCEWFAKLHGVEYFHIDPLNMDITHLTNVVSHQYAKTKGILPVEIGMNSVKFACKFPFEIPWRDELENLLRKEVEVCFANPNDIDRYLNEFYSLSRSLNQSSLGTEDLGTSVQQSLEQLIDLGKRGQLDAEDHHIVQVVDWLLQYAFEQRASDIHLEPRRERGEVRFRIDGILHYAYQVPNNVMLAIIGRLKTLGRMDIAEKRRPLDGRIKTRTPNDTEIELRLSTVPTAMGEKMVIRIFDPEVLQRSFEDLGIGNRELDLWHTMTRHTHGIILVTGPTGSGKTTTLYSTLRSLATSEVNVCTIEDPIEMVEPTFNQIQTHDAIGLSFAAGVKSLLRQDPDIIMIGEIRDLATAEMAIQASLTGHLVLSTLHTNDAVSAITRLLELGVPAYLINSTVLGVLAQRLVRTLCPTCKKPNEIDKEEWQRFTRDNSKPPTTSCTAEGCLECRQTGFKGRIGLYEMLEMTDDFKSLVTEKMDLVKARDQAVNDGLLTLRDNGIKQVESGITTMDEVYRVTPYS